jgi:hypothetical protein
MTKHLLLTAGLAALITAYSAASPSPAKASWAETPQGNPVYTGTDRSLRRSERAVRGRAYRTPGYSAYGSYYGDAPAYGAYRGYAPGDTYYGGYEGGYYRY